MTTTKRAPGFKKGTSGNPSGRPKGSRNRATLLAIAAMEGELDAVVRVVIDAALAGDMVAARLVVDKLIPATKERALSLELPDSSTPEGIELAQSVILAAVGAGELLPGEGTTLSAIVENRRRSIETLELEQRIAALEGQPK